MVKQSRLYETEPVELREQEWFLNGVIEVETDQKPAQLMEMLLTIERAAGRERTVPKGPRTIDMDILLFGDQVIHEGNLEIPHPRMANRRFVLVPLADIAPDAVHPTLPVSYTHLDVYKRQVLLCYHRSCVKTTPVEAARCTSPNNAAAA